MEHKTSFLTVPAYFRIKNPPKITREKLEHNALRISYRNHIIPGKMIDRRHGVFFTYPEWVLDQAANTEYVEPWKFDPVKVFERFMQF